MEEWSFAPYARSLRAETLQTPPPFSGATQLGLSNPVARTEYHRQLVLSTPFSGFCQNFFACDSFSLCFLHSAQRKAAKPR